MIGFASVLAVVLGFGVPASAQGDKPTQDKAAPTPGSANVAAMIPLRVQVVISRMQGDKKILSVPYTLSVSAQDKNDRPQSEMSRLRMGARVPVPLPISNGQTVPFNYQDLGTNIDCHATIADAGRFKLDVTIEDSSLYTADELGQLVKGTNATVFRQFRVSNSAILRDGQTTQFTTATDRISGETVRVDVSLSVLK
jgi:hypothetical protein